MLQPPLKGMRSPLIVSSQAWGMVVTKPEPADEAAAMSIL
jgi:hypothetical protein